MPTNHQELTTMSNTLTTRERRALNALRFALEANACDRVALSSVQTASRVLRQPRMSDDAILTGLTRLVIKGVVVRDVVSGMGGSMSAWGIAR